MSIIAIFQDNPTAGGTDGVEVSSNGALTAPISFVLDAAQNETKTLKLAVRTGTGYVTDGTVTISDKNDTDDHLKLCWTENGTFADSISTTDQIGSTNKIFYAKATSHDTEYPIYNHAVRFVVNAGIKKAV